MRRDSFCRVFLEGICKEETGCILTVYCLVLLAAESSTHGISSSRPTGPMGPTGRNDVSFSLKEVEGRCVKLTTEMWKVMD